MSTSLSLLLSWSLLSGAAPQAQDWPEVEIVHRPRQADWCIYGIALKLGPDLLKDQALTDAALIYLRAKAQQSLLSSLRIQLSPEAIYLTGAASPKQLNQKLEKLFRMFDGRELSSWESSWLASARKNYLRSDLTISYGFLQRALFAQHPYGRWASYSAAELVPQAEVVALVKQMARLDSLKVFIGGKIPPDTKDQLGEYLEAWPLGDGKPKVWAAPKPRQSQGLEILLIDRPGPRSAQLWFTKQIPPQTARLATLVLEDELVLPPRWRMRMGQLYRRRAAGLWLHLNPPVSEIVTATQQVVRGIVNTQETLAQPGRAQRVSSLGKLRSAEAQEDLRRLRSLSLRSFAAEAELSEQSEWGPGALEAALSDTYSLEGWSLVLMTALTPTLQRKLSQIPGVSRLTVHTYEQN